MQKKWWQSWTVWANVLGVILIILNHATLNGWIPAEAEALGIAIVNFILRFKTNAAIK